MFRLTDKMEPTEGPEQSSIPSQGEGTENDTAAREITEGLAINAMAEGRQKDIASGGKLIVIDSHFVSMQCPAQWVDKCQGGEGILIVRLVGRKGKHSNGYGEQAK